MLEEIIRKTIDEMKILRVKCTPVGIIAKGIDMASAKQIFVSITDLVWIRNILNKIETK